MPTKNSIYLYTKNDIASLQKKRICPTQGNRMAFKL